MGRENNHGIYGLMLDAHFLGLLSLFCYFHLFFSSVALHTWPPKLFYNYYSLYLSLCASHAK